MWMMLQRIALIDSNSVQNNSITIVILNYIRMVLSELSLLIVDYLQVSNKIKQNGNGSRIHS